MAFALLAACTQQAASEDASSTAGLTVTEARTILTGYDDNDRLTHSRITKVGDVQVGNRHYSVFDLDFTNPVSNHGMQQVAIFEGGVFRGSFQTDGAAISIAADKIRFTCKKGDEMWCSRTPFTEIDLSKPTLPRQVLITGGVRDLQNGI